MEHEFYCSIQLGIVTPSDEIIFFRVAKPPSSIKRNLVILSCYIVIWMNVAHDLTATSLRNDVFFFILLGNFPKYSHIILDEWVVIIYPDLWYVTIINLRVHLVSQLGYENPLEETMVTMAGQGSIPPLKLEMCDPRLKFGKWFSCSLWPCLGSLLNVRGLWWCMKTGPRYKLVLHEL